MKTLKVIVMHLLSGYAFSELSAALIAIYRQNKGTFEMYKLGKLINSLKALGFQFRKMSQY